MRAELELQSVSPSSKASSSLPARGPLATVNSSFSPFRRCVSQSGPPSPPTPAPVPDSASRMLPSCNHYNNRDVAIGPCRPSFGRDPREPRLGGFASAVGQCLGASRPYLGASRPYLELLPLRSHDQHCKMTRRFWP